MTPFLAALVADAPAAVHQPANLSAQRWRKRVVLAFAPEAADPRLQAQRRQMAALTGAQDDRDLIFVPVVGGRVDGLADRAADLRARFHVPAAAFRVLLIGKDGGVKLDDGGVISAARLASTIDAMPMRRDEVRR